MYVSSSDEAPEQIRGLTFCDRNDMLEAELELSPVLLRSADDAKF